MDFSIFRNLLGNIPWEQTLQGREVQEIPESLPPGSRTMHLDEQEIGQREQETCTDEYSSVSRKYTGDGSRVRPLGMNIERKVVGVRRNGTRKTKVPLELNLAKDVKDNKKGFFKYINRKTKTRDRVGLLVNGEGDGSW
ncbi:hypothetical protein WISP_84387 [Willisornis vidua]|uniref:Uncharacterized protein n=1 Tax=Willisornis vidua TaxID=1566151 RepID=A0ABQ9D3Q8_9PASS|nr:hypothetical protein WISP_84387 [Willisornis vidua]